MVLRPYRWVLQLLETHTYIFCHADRHNLIGHRHNSGTWHSVVDLHLQDRQTKQREREQTWKGSKHESQTGALTAVAGTMWFLRNSSSLLWPWEFRNNNSGSFDEWKGHWWICVAFLTLGLLRYCRCSSIIASNAAVVGANTVIGPGWSRTDARVVSCSRTTNPISTSTRRASGPTEPRLKGDFLDPLHGWNPQWNCGR